MHITELPSFIVNSGIFNENDLDKLASIDRFPTDEEIDVFKFEPEIQELLNAFIGDENTRMTHQLLKAKEFLDQNEIQKAWKLVLL
ncbi:hypothetical protein ACFQ2C_17025 [Sphingobacterium daejeonense]|jgi:hypothetical protein|uniref:Uncharacterized protein n=1 Tax=Sphingobacterium daejeonense TaxID=371142 RepID=A0ABW3RPY9_9SPHI